MNLDTVKNIGELFQEYTKYQYFSEPSRMSLGAPIPPAQKEIQPDQKVISLPDGKRFLENAEPTVAKIFDERRSRRNYADNDIPLGQLAALLWATQGVKRSGLGYSLRTAPSAGARHPLETYLHINRVENLEQGLYRYQPLNHQLVQINAQDLSMELMTACLGQQMVADCSVVFIWTAVIERSRWKYQQRAYRYIYLDAGHVCQNLYLACEALKLACCAIAAFHDDAVNEILGIDGKEEFVIYLATVGVRK